MKQIFWDLLYKWFPPYQLYRFLRFYFYSWSEDPKYYCSYDKNVVHGGFVRGIAEGREFERMIQDEERKGNVKHLPE